MTQRRMDRAALDGIELEYEVRGGAGEPVVLIHPGHFADWFTPLLNESALMEHYRVLWYHRAGCMGSSRIAGPVSLAQQAAHCRALMRHLGIARAHVVGHSSSGNIALQLALDVPEAVHTLAVLEPALYAVPSAQTSRAFVGVAVQRYRAGDTAGAIDTFLRGVCGPGYRAVLDQALPDAFDQHVADADTFFD
jgi:pimeloyl-ACP methyl ester carboxylesterase